MRTKLFNPFFSVTLLAIFTLFIVSCEEEDNTGYSTMKPGSPAISITPGFTSPVTLTENDAKYEFTVKLSEAQLVDVHLNVAQVGGTASASDYELSTPIVITAGATSAKGSIKILSDDVVEGTENLIVQIGDQTTANASLTPVKVEFQIKNLTVNDLSIGLSWEPSTKTTDNSGNEIAATDLADMRLLITDDPYTTVIDGADGASFESYTLESGMDDGTYLVVADFYDAMASPVRDLDLTVSFEQLGVFDPYSFEFPAAINTAIKCEANYYILARITKAGSNFNIEKAGKVPPLTGKWFGLDTESEYASQVKTWLNCDMDLLITGLCFEWMEDFWGEEIVKQEDVIIEVNEAAGTVNIPFQPYITTLYKNVEYPYSIQGTGTLNTSGTYPVMTITYVLDQDGFDPSGWCFENGYMTGTKFIATLTLDPAGLKSAKIKSSSLNKALVKPVR